MRTRWGVWPNRARGRLASLALALSLIALAIPAARAADRVKKGAAPTAPSAAKSENAAAELEGLPRWEPPGQYRVDLIMTNGDQTMTMHRYFSGANLRSEIEAQGQQFVMLELGDESYQIMPSQKTMMKMPAPAAMVAGHDSAGGPPADVRIEKLGAEKLEGRVALKFRFVSQDREGLAWFDPANGAPLRMESNGAVIEWRNFSAEPQPAKLFELPKDYKVFDFGEMQKAMGQAGGGIPTMPAGIPGMPGGAGGPGGVSGLADRLGSQMGQNFGEQMGAGVGAQFGPLGSIAGRYIGGRVGHWVGSKAAHLVTGGSH